MAGKKENGFPLDMQQLEEADDETFNLLFGDGEGEVTDLEPPAKRVVAPVSDKLSVLRGFPTVITMIAKQEFPDARNNTDAVVAYLYCFCPEVAENPLLRSLLTEDQWDLIKRHKAGAYTMMAARLVAIKKKLDNLASDHKFMRTLLTYFMYDRLGLRMESANPNTMEFDLNEDGRLLQFATMLEEAEADFRKQKAAMDGRPLNY